MNANQNKSITNKRTVHNIPALDVTKNGDIVKINKENRLNIFNFFDVDGCFLQFSKRLFF